MKALKILALPMLLAACSAPATTPSPQPQARPGSDRDAHGCIGSAGYQWCPRSQRCERPWELAKAKGLPNTAEAVAQYCAAASPASE